MPTIAEKDVEAVRDLSLRTVEKLAREKAKLAWAVFISTSLNALLLLALVGMTFLAANCR